jgi:thioredoxin 1
VSTIEITKENFDEEVTDSDVPVIIDLWAPWCGPCKSMAPVLDDLAEEYEGKVKVGKVNVEEERELAESFRVQSIPMVVALEGEEVKDQMICFSGEEPLRNLFETAAGN